MKISEFLRVLAAVCGAIMLILLFFGGSVPAVAGVVSYTMYTVPYWSVLAAALGSLLALASFVLEYFFDE